MTAITKTSPPTKRLIILDAHAIIHRAYHALPDFTSSAGEPTGGLYGLATMTLKIIDDLQPDYLVAGYDLPAPTFRKELYDAYKAGRKKADEALIAQLERSRALFAALNVPLYDAPGFEADDIIGTVVSQLAGEKNLEIIIATGDMDTLQLVASRRVRVFTLKKGITDTVLYDEEAVEKRFGFGPELLPDFKGLRGDPSDNIIGVAGIGEKTATTLVQKFGSLEKMYQLLKKDSAPLAAAGLSERLIGLVRDGEEEALFSKMLATIRRDAPINFSLPSASWREGLALAPAEEFFRQLDFKSLLPRLRALVPASVVSTDTVAVGATDEAVPTEEMEKTGLALWLINSELTTPSLEDILHYAETTDFSQAREKIFARLQELALEKVYREIELPLMPILATAQGRGILIDRAQLSRLAKDYHRQLAALEKNIYRGAGVEFNINSPKQLGEIIFDKLKLTAKRLKKTAGGARSTRESELEKLRDQHPIIADILQYREYQKLLSTYIDNIPPLLDANDCLHSRLHQAGTTTGRMSSSHPNLQNIPIRGEAGRAIRNAFVSRPGHLLLACDYSQIEMRVLAELSGDDSLRQIFRTGEDVHTAVAARVFKVGEGAVTKDMRRQAKVINFGIMYGMGVNALKDNLGTTREEAQKFYDQYFAAYPTIRHYFDTVVADAYRRGYTETLFGRRRYFPGLQSKLPFIRAAAERMAMNAPIQGTGADIVKLAMIRVEDHLQKNNLSGRVHFLLQIHDELIYEVEEVVAEKLQPEISALMEGAVTASIPFSVNTALGRRWGELE